MPKTSVSTSPSIPRGLILNLDQIAEHIDNGRLNEALGLIRFARARAELAVKPERETDPMEVINDVACYVEQVAGLGDLLTAVSTEDLCDGTLAKVGYAIRGLMERAGERICEARRPGT
jgi:hypothetical protein